MRRKRTTKRFPGISDAELGLLKALWESGPASPQGLQERLRSDGTDRAYTTVQTLLHRLLRKGWVARRREGVAQIYSAAVDREELLAEHMSDLAARMCDGAASPLLLSLVRSRRFSGKELARFREILAEADPGGKTERGGKR